MNHVCNNHNKTQWYSIYVTFTPCPKFNHDTVQSSCYIIISSTLNTPATHATFPKANGVDPVKMHCITDVGRRIPSEGLFCWNFCIFYLSFIGRLGGLVSLFWNHEMLHLLQTGKTPYLTWMMIPNPLYFFFCTQIFASNMFTQNNDKTIRLLFLISWSLIWFDH